MARRNYDWKTFAKREWPYKGDLNDPRYIKDRNELFEENGNGWWIFQGYCTKKNGKWQASKRSSAERKRRREEKGATNGTSK